MPNTSTQNSGLRIDMRNWHYRIIRHRGNPTPRLKGLIGTLQSKKGKIILTLGKDTRRRERGGTVATTTDRPYRIMTAVRKFSPC
ncbi:unnamed protein product [Prunus armeniaca]